MKESTRIPGLPSGPIGSRRPPWLLLFALLGPAAGCEGEKGEDGLFPDPSISERDLDGPMESVYKYTDDRGTVNYVDSLEKIPPRYRKKAVHPTGGTVTILPHSSIDELLSQRGIDARRFGAGGAARPPGSGRVVLYTTAWCPYCTRARDHLRQRGVAFSEKDIEKNTDDLKEMLSKSGGSRGVPVIDVRGTVLRGYSSEALDRALGR